ncbi:hypothetical protein SBA7_1310016 [Candidatus Sulfotelmatobacter sp. SbA7]|nr:hypothetical protein SBA7_1310016 [Candidatus Sulfotelmatobacter sp. SbA7]
MAHTLTLRQCGCIGRGHKLTGWGLLPRLDSLSLSTHAFGRSAIFSSRINSSLRVPTILAVNLNDPDQQSQRARKGGATSGKRVCFCCLLNNQARGGPQQ